MPREPWVRIAKKERLLKILPRTRVAKLVPHPDSFRVEAERGRITVHFNEETRIHFSDREGELHIVVEHPELGTFGGKVKGHEWGVISKDKRWRDALFRFLRGVPSKEDFELLDDFFARWTRVATERVKQGMSVGYLALDFGEEGEHRIHLDMRFLASLFSYFHRWSPLRQKILPNDEPSSGRGGRRGSPGLRWRR